MEQETQTEQELTAKLTIDFQSRQKWWILRMQFAQFVMLRQLANQSLLSHVLVRLKHTKHILAR